MPAPPELEAEPDEERSGDDPERRGPGGAARALRGRAPRVPRARPRARRSRRGRRRRSCRRARPTRAAGTPSAGREAGRRPRRRGSLSRPSRGAVTILGSPDEPAFRTPLGDGRRHLPLRRARIPRDRRRGARDAFAARVRRLRDRHLRDGLLPGALRSHRRGGARQVRLPLRRARGLGPAAAALPERVRLQARRARCSARVGLVVFAFLGPHRLQAPLLVAAGIPLGQSLEGSPARRSTCAAATTSARRSSSGRWRCGSPGSRSARITASCRRRRRARRAGARRRRRSASRAGSRFTASRGAVASARRGPARDPSVRRAVERRQPASSRCAAASRRSLLGAVTSTTQVGAVQGRAGAAVGLPGALRARAHGAAHRADARLGARDGRRPCCAGVRRYSADRRAADARRRAAALLLACPTSCKLVYSAEVRSSAANAARVFLVAAAVQIRRRLDEVVPRLDRPAAAADHRRTASSRSCILPLVIVLGCYWGATGAAVAVLVGDVRVRGDVGVIFVRIEPDDVVQPRRRRGVAQEEAEAEVLAR